MRRSQLRIRPSYSETRAGHPLRLAYKSGRLSDGLEVRSAGPDGEWNTRDDVVVPRASPISGKALVRDATGNLIDAARDRYDPGRDMETHRTR